MATDTRATQRTLDALRARYRVSAKTGRAVSLNASRNDLPALVRMLGFRHGAEIGVWRGAYSALFCEAHPSLHMLCVDPWQPHQAWLDTKNKLGPEEGAKFIEEAYQMARARLAPLNATIVRKFSTEAAREVPDRSLDFIFIDGNHVYDAVLEDLEAWAPKVRSGGLVSGHDYRINPKKPFIQVVAAVQRFTADHGIDPWFVLSRDRSPSFLWVAP